MKDWFVTQQRIKRQTCLKITIKVFTPEILILKGKEGRQQDYIFPDFLFWIFKKCVPTTFTFIMLKIVGKVGINKGY